MRGIAGKLFIFLGCFFFRDMARRRENSLSLFEGSTVVAVGAAPNSPHSGSSMMGDGARECDSRVSTGEEGNGTDEDWTTDATFVDERGRTGRGGDDESGTEGTRLIGGNLSRLGDVGIGGQCEDARLLDGLLLLEANESVEGEDAIKDGKEGCFFAFFPDSVIGGLEKEPRQKRLMERGDSGGDCWEDW
jgi:hypothetical protein